MPKKQKDGYYRTKIRVCYDPNGNPIDKWVRAKTRAELEKKKNDLKQYYIDGAVQPDRNVVFGDFATEWYHAHKEPFISESGKCRYRAILNNYLFPYLAERHITAISHTDLQGILNKLQGKSISYIKSAKGCLHAIFSEAVHQRIIAYNPADSLQDPNHADVKEKRPLTPEERALVEAAIVDIPWLAILYYTGIRSGELRALRWEDIDLRGEEIHIDRALGIRATDVTPCKNKQSRRTVPIVPQLAAILQKHIALPATPVTEVYLSNHQMIWLFKQTAKAIGLPDDISMHCFRHNFITQCWERRVDVMTVSRVVGHAHPSITMDIYTHLDNVTARKTQAEIARAFQ